MYVVRSWPHTEERGGISTLIGTGNNIDPERLSRAFFSNGTLPCDHGQG
jgi:hypothetical protein